MPPRSLTRSALTAAAILAVTGVAQAQTYIRMDIGPTGQRVPLSGWTTVGTVAPLTNASNFPATSFTSLTGDSFTLEINNLDATGVALGAIDWRDRGDATSTDDLPRVGEDFIKNNLGVIRLTLGSIPAGQYSMTSYHIDPDNSQSNAIRVFVSDSTQSFAQQPSQGNAGPLTGGTAALTSNSVSASAATFSFTSNGTDPIVILFDGRNSPNADPEVPLNGFVLSQVPEPSTAALLGVGALALARRRRR